MRRLGVVWMASLQGGTPTTSGASSLTVASSSSSPASVSALTEQRCGLRNLHQYPHARYKSLVKDTHRFARNWWLTAGNNYELVSEMGHEREASENFGVYRDDSEKDRFLLSTRTLADLPPAKRLDALVEVMRERWKVRDNNRGFDKARLLLEALECFSELRLSGKIPVFDALPEADQDTFLQYVEGCAQYAQACSHSHPDAVAVLLRAAYICDELRCQDKRDEMLHVAEVAARRIDRAYAFARPREGVRLTPPSVEEVSRQWNIARRNEMKQLFKDHPGALEERSRHDCFYGARNRKQVIYPMRTEDPRQRLIAAPYRPESDSWSNVPL